MASRQTAGHHQLSPLSFRCRHSSVNRIVRRRASFIIASVRFFLKSRPPSAQGREDVLPEWLGSGLAGGVVTVGHCVGLFLPAARAASPAQGLPQRRRVSAWVPADDPHGWGRQKVEWIEASSGTLGSGLAGGGAFNGHCVGLFLLVARAASPAQGLPQRRVSAWVPTFYCKFR